MLADPLAEDDLATNRSAPPAKKLAQALEMMESGMRLKRAALAHKHKNATDEQLDELMKVWLCSDG